MIRASFIREDVCSNLIQYSNINSFGSTCSSQNSCMPNLIHKIIVYLDIQTQQRDRHQNMKGSRKINTR